MESLNSVVAAPAMEQMQRPSSSMPEMQKDSGLIKKNDTAAISETGLHVASIPRQPAPEASGSYALTDNQLEEMFGESLATALGGLLNNGNYMSGTSESGVQVDIERITEASEKGPLQTGILDTSEVLGYTASITTTSGKLNISFVDNVLIQEMEDGRTSVYFKESDTTRYYAAVGSYTEESGNLLRQDNGAIFINISGDVHAGSGDNLIFNWADDAKISRVFTG